MQIVLVQFKLLRRWRDLAMVLLVLGGLAVFLHAAGLGVCPLMRLTGFPCPTCGATRAGLALVQGEFVRAWFFNPFAAVLFLLAGLYAATAGLCLVLTCRIPVIHASRKAWRLAGGAGLLLAILNWFFMIARNG